MAKRQLDASEVLLLCGAGFVLGRLFAFPGFLDPFVPSHSDLYRFFLLSQAQWGSHVWLAPRPLMRAFLHLVGPLRYPELVWFVLSLTSIAFAAVVILLLRHLTGLRPSVISILLYSTVIFSLPSSFEIYQLDYGGMLAGVLSAGAIYAWYRFYRTRTSMAYAMSLTLFWLSLEMKPTFAAAMLVLALLQSLVHKDKKTLLLFIGVTFILVLTNLKDWLFGSPFLQFGDRGGVYDIQFDPIKNLGALWAYMKSALPTELLAGLAIAYYLAWKALGSMRAVIAVFLLLAVSSVIPMAMIPNRTLDLYSWYPGMLISLPFLIVFYSEIGGQLRSDRIPVRTFGVLSVACLAVTLVALGLSSKVHAAHADFDAFISRHNRNVISSLDRLSDGNLEFNLASSKGILITGLRGPSHPFRNRTYILDRTHLPDTYVLLLRESERAWNDQSRDMGPGIYSGELDAESFDHFIVHDEAGNLWSILSLEQMMVMPKWRRLPTLICNLSPALQIWTVSNVEVVVGCLDEAGESAATIELMNNVRISSPSPLLHYYLGHAYESIGDASSARTEYVLALASGDNEYFRSALENLPDE